MSDNQHHSKVPLENTSHQKLDTSANTTNSNLSEKNLADEREKQSIKNNEGWWKRVDRSLLSTIALAIISLGALFVSIYQTRVLSLQQEVMAEQQRIMTENAKAQAWPNIEIESVSNTSEGNTSSLRFTIIISV